MDCCLVRVMFLLLTVTAIFACPGQNHPQHEQHNHTHAESAGLYSHADNLLGENEKNVNKDNNIHDESTTPSNWTHYVECSCALFFEKSPIETDAPIMSKTFENVSCEGNASGKDACSEVCISFASSQDKEKDKIICSKLHNVTDLTGYWHSKMCKQNHVWSFTGLTNLEPLCCAHGQSVNCNSTTPSSKV